MKARKLRLLAVMLSAMLVFNSVTPAFAETSPETTEVNVKVDETQESDYADEATELDTVCGDEKDPAEKNSEAGTKDNSDEEQTEDIEEEISDGEVTDEEEIVDEEEGSEAEQATPSEATSPEAETESAETVLTWEGEGLKVTMTAPEGALDVPEEVTLFLVVEPIEENILEELLDTLEEKKGIKKEAGEVIAYDIRVIGSDDREYQPKKAVSVVFTDIVSELAAVSDAVSEGMETEDLDIYHFDEEAEKVELVKPLAEEKLPEDVEAGDDDIAVQVTHFSPWIIVPVSSLGDLWCGWDMYAADAYKPNGSGTEADPYEIANIGNLMWLSVSVTKGTAGVAGAWYVMSSDIDLADLPASCGDWHPIGWYASKTSPAAYKPFKGHFNGNGHTVSGLEIIETTGFNLQNVGLFGVLEGAEVRDLSIEAGTVNGYDYVGILAGQILGASDIHYVTVSGAANCGISTTGASTSAHVGGIAGNVNGSALTAAGAAVIEDCRAENITLYSTGANSAVGGIAGTAAKAYIVDSYVLADSSQNIQGLGYVGGIVGYQTAANIYNSYIDGTIGGNGSIAAGGVTGKFESGEIYLVQMNGEIGSTNKSVTHEGIIVGTRNASTTFVYGTKSTDKAGYLYYNADVKGMAVNGSGISGDADGAAKSAHTGFWTDNELKYTVVEGSNEYPCEASRYYYEELEDGVKFILTEKLGKSFTVQDYANGLRFAINHYAPGANGAPIPGHLVSIPQVNSQNSVDLDVAYFTAVAGDGSLFYKVMDKDSAAAVAPGTLVTVTSSAKNKPVEGKYFQRVVDETVDPEKTVRPTYTDASSGTTEEYDMDYQTGGTYTFTMPESDTELNILYEKVLSEVVTDPTETTINIVETRTGDRKNPLVTWRITDENGHTLCNNITRTKKESDPITGELLSNSDVTSVGIDVIFNSVSLDNKVMWSVDDPTLINTTGTDTVYTKNQAKIKPEVTESNVWLVQILNEAETKQKNSNYTTAIASTVYSKKAVLTATTDPDHSVDNKSVYAHCDVNFTFQIIDNTTLQTEGVSLDKHELTFTVTRNVTGKRRAPEESFTITGLQSLKASVTPAESDVRAVTWEMTGNGATSLSKTASGTYDHDLAVKSVFDGTDLSKLPDWMKELYDADNAAKTADKNHVMTGSGTRTAIIKVTATDREKGVHTDTCNVTINYVTKDTTPDVNELNISDTALDFTITRNLTGSRSNPTDSYSVTAGKKISVSLSDNASFMEDVKWTVDPAIAQSLKNTYGGSHKCEDLVSIGINTGDVSSFPAWIYNVVNADDASWSANKNVKRQGTATVTGFITAESDDVTVPDGIKEIKKCKVTIVFKTEDSTSANGSTGGGGSSGGGGGGGGGGSSTTSVSLSGVQTLSTTAPVGVLSGGTWVETNGVWIYLKKDGSRVTNGWAAIVNPSAPTGTQNWGWFAFDPAGNMRVGWFTDSDGQTYYLKSDRDGTYGVMLTGKQAIGGVWYYFAPKTVKNTDGTIKHSEGALYRNETTPDGETVNALGQIVVNGVVQKVK